MTEQYKPLVSIITPCFNSSRFIRECVDSVLVQDYYHVEHIIQDGGSNDGTYEILKEYAKKYTDRIFVVSEPDKGQSDGLNKALQRSRGEFILVLNADDALYPHACSWGVKNLQNNSGVAAIYGDVDIVDEQSVVVEKYHASPYNFEKLLCVELVPPAQASFIRRSSFEKVGFYTDKDLDTCPDYEMWVRLGLKFPIQYVPGVITKYRRHYQVFDSKAPRTTERFFKSKKIVMDRVFNAPKTPKNIKKLRARAYDGLSMWALITDLGVILKAPTAYTIRGTVSLNLIKTFPLMMRGFMIPDFRRHMRIRALSYFKRAVRLLM